MTEQPFQHLGDQLRHQGYLWRVVSASFRDPRGREFTRDVVRSPGAVGVLALWRDELGSVHVRLVRQYRPVVDRYVTEIPAGMRDIPGETPEMTARRELAEEVGLDADTWIHVTDILPSPGMSDGTTVLFFATGVRAVPSQAHGPEEEFLDIIDTPLDTAVDAVELGAIVDAKTVVALLVARRRLDEGTLIAKPWT